MAALCDFCAKRRQYGNLVSHSKRRTPTSFKVNLHRRRVIVGGVGRSMKLCTNCIKLLRKKQKAGERTPVTLITHTPESQT